MCKECGKSICPSMCPNAPEPSAVYICDGCGYGIYEGEHYWKFDGKRYCENCVDDAEEEAWL